MNIAKGILSIIGLALLPVGGAIASFTCSTSLGVGYCNYTGPVSRAYVNASGAILLYLDTPFDLSLPASQGISGVTQNNAVIYRMSNNADFGKSLYATLLVAQAEGKNVQVQLNGVDSSGYLIMDRIWLSK